MSNRFKRSDMLLGVFLAAMLVGLVGIYLWEPGVEAPTQPLQEPEKPSTIGVIEVYGVMDEEADAYLLRRAIMEALRDDSVKAVVLDVNSPGGVAFLVEEVYWGLKALGEEKPVVAHLSMALSGGYYVAVASQEIYALPSAMVGNIGVLGRGPPWLVPSESTLETGPRKVTGFSPSLYPFNLTTVLESFLEAVEGSRGGHLTISSERLASGSIWMGVDAEEIGLVDGLGGLQSALDRAAELAGVEDYEVESLVSRVSNESKPLVLGFPTLDQLDERNPPPALYYLYLPGAAFQAEEDQPGGGEPNITDTKGDILVDLSHGNRVSPWVLDALVRQITEKGLYTGYARTRQGFMENLNQSRALVVACPTQPYSGEEVEAVERWVEAGGVLLLLGDASAEFLEPGSLLAPLNSLANLWGIHFGNGYLYNQEHYHGFYRNIFAEPHGGGTLTEGVGEVVFYTACPVYSSGLGALTATPGTFDSVTEEEGPFDVVAVYGGGEPRVVAVGDVSWLMEPFVGEADNRRLLENLVELLGG